MDFYEARYERKERPVRLEVYPEFFIDKSEDLMIRGGDFYAVWDEATGMWSRNSKLVRKMVDIDLRELQEKLKADPRNEGTKVTVRDMRSNSSGSWKSFLRYIESLPDDYHQLDEKLIFQDTKTTKTDYASKRLPYSMQEGDISAYEEIVSTLYAPEERAKFEWAIGSILAGDSKKIQKFIVFHGPMGTGKSTIMNLIEKLFGGYKTGYCAKINAQALVGGNVGFALTPFAKSPLVGIDQDSKLSRIEDNTILNQIVSHDTLEINQKFKDLYESSAQCMLFMGTNEPVKITNSKSGIIRRLIDVEPTGNIISPESRYEQLIGKMDYELGAIAKHCLDVYKKMGKSYYSKYIPKRMMLRTDPFFNFMLDNLEVFQRNGGVTANELWAMYKSWCDDSGMDFRLKRFQAIDEAKSYFEDFEERVYMNGKQVRNWFSGIKTEKFKSELKDIRKEHFGSQKDVPGWLEMKETGRSLLDQILADCKAQYGDEKPSLYWKDVNTVLRGIDTRQTHYVQPPHNLITIDLDKKNSEGEKDFMENVRAIVRLGLPETYAELSKGGRGIHLEYWYDGESDDLSRLIEEDVEVKVMTGNSALRRRLSLCNNLPIAHISSGLPIKKKKAVINEYALKDAKHLHNKIMMALRKEVEPKATRTSMMYIRDCLKEAQEKGIEYDFKYLDNAIYSFAANSTHSQDFCIGIYKELKLRWPEETVANSVPDPAKQIVLSKWVQDAPIILFDVEVLKNLFIVVYKEVGPKKKCTTMINPKPYEMEALFNTKLVGFNNRGYDNFIMWAAYKGYTNEQLYELSQQIIVGGDRMPDKNAVNISFTDIYDYCSTKQSLKKWEVEISQKREAQIEKARKLMAEGKSISETAEAIKLPQEYLECYMDGTLQVIGHKEFAWPWDQPLPEDKWDECAKYCVNDVLATEQVWIETQSDFKAREILAEISGGSVNDTTNQLTAKFIFGDTKDPWKQFVYPDLKAKFPGYSFAHGKSYYRHEIQVPDPWQENYAAICERYPKRVVDARPSDHIMVVDELIGEGGRVYANPGMYHNVKTFDVASMHPSSIIAENGFGPFTKRFKEIMDIRIAIKHKDFEGAKKMLDGKLAPYLDDPAQAKQLSFALKIAINSVYGLTAAKFQNKFKDPRNIDNWVAKRGALFMETLRLKVQALGATVVHIKTDSIKIADPTPEVEAFILKYGKDWGYNFEVESIYNRICLVNDAVYIAKCSMDPENGDEAGHWTATGAQFQHPYVFKTLFSKEPIKFVDLCETKSVKTEMYLDMNEAKPDVEPLEKRQEKLLKGLGKTFGADLQNVMDVYDGFAPDYISENLWKKYPDEGLRDAAWSAISEIRQLEEEIIKAHDYQFVGRTGSFCPIISGKGGGKLLRKGTDGKYGAVGGTKDYRWLEADFVKSRNYQENIDMSYFRDLADVAMQTIGVYGNFELFVSEDDFNNGTPPEKSKICLSAFERNPYITMKMASANNPPWLTPCCSAEYEYCSDCPHYYGEQEYCCKMGYNVSNQIITD